MNEVQVSDTPPSAFLNAGFPNCSIFGETWHEVAAQAYLLALVVEGDTWQQLTPEQVARAVGRVPVEQRPGLADQSCRDMTRLRRVAEVLRNADDARAFCLRWSRVGLVS